MATPTVGSIGTKLNLLIKQGSTFGPHTVTVTDAGGDPLDLTGADVRAQLRRHALDVDVVAAFDVALAADPTTGAFTFGLSDEATAAIVTGELPEKPASKFVWDLEVEVGGTVMPVFYGDVTVFREVTRDP